MGDATNTITIHITRREQIILGRVLLAPGVEIKGKEEREKKAAAFQQFGLTWIRDTLEEPPETSIQVPELVQAYETAVAQGQDKVTAMTAVANRVFSLRDPFAGHHTTEASTVEVSRAASAWVLEKLNAATVGGVDDFVIAELEDRIASARRGDYRLPVAAEEKAA